MGTYSGIYAVIKPDKKFTLEFDSASIDTFISNLQLEADVACKEESGANIIANPTISNFKASYSKRKTRLNCHLRLQDQALMVRLVENSNINLNRN